MTNLKDLMTMQKYVIELRVDYPESPEKYEIIKTQVLEKARELKSIASLMMEKRAPQCAVQVGDFFAGDEDINLLEGIEDPRL